MFQAELNARNTCLNSNRKEGTNISVSEFKILNKHTLGFPHSVQQIQRVHFMYEISCLYICTLFYIKNTY